MSSQKTTTKKKLENMHLRERINYGYNKVIMMMLISGLFSIVVIGVLFANMVHYVKNVAAADEAVKICRINVNASARNIREMALNDDTSSYDGYEQTVKKMLTEVDSELKILKKTGTISKENYEEYAAALSDWGNIGYSIIDEIKNGDREKAVDDILNDCTPALNKLVDIATKLDEETDQMSNQSSRTTFIFAIAGTVFNIVGPKILGKATTELFNGLVAKVNGTGEIDFGKIGMILLWTLGLYVLSACFSFVQGFVMSGISNDVTYNLRKDISKKINRLPLNYYESRTNGEILSRITNDVDTLQMSLNQSLT